MKQTKKYSYFNTLWESFADTCKNPLLFLPYLLSFIISLPLIFYLNTLTPQQNIFQIKKILIILSITTVLLFLVQGWFLSMLNLLFTKKHINLVSSIKKTISFAIRSTLINLIILLTIALAYLLLVVIITLLLTIGLNLAIIGIISIVLIAIFVVSLVIYASAFFQITPVLAIENKGIIETIKMTIRFYFKKKLYSLNILAVSTLVILALSIPSIIYSFMVPKVGLTITQLIIQQILSLPVYFGTISLIIYYCKSYKIKKATIK